jgi:hypothetical protein
MEESLTLLQHQDSMEVLDRPTMPLPNSELMDSLKPLQGKERRETFMLTQLPQLLELE